MRAMRPNDNVFFDDCKLTDLYLRPDARLRMNTRSRCH